MAASLAAGAILSLSVGGAASAKPFATVTYSGQAWDISDPTGLFGAPRQDWFRAPYVSIFKVDLSKGYLNHYNFGGIPEDQLLGGSLYHAPTPIVGASLEINGHAVQFAADRVGQEDNRKGELINSVAWSGAVGGESGFSSVLSEDIETNAPLSLFAPFTGVSTPVHGFLGSFSICYLKVTSSNSSACFPEGRVLRGFLTAQSVTISISDAVPEPSLWMLMVSGATCAGAVLRRGRKIAADVRTA